MKTSDELKAIASRFDIHYKVLEVNTLGEGFINDTYIVDTTTPQKFILQRKNSSIFKNIPGMVENILKVTNHLKYKISAAGGDQLRESLTLIRTLEGGLYYLDNEGDYWVMTLYIQDTVTYTSASNAYLAEQGGIGIGRFQSMMSDFTEELVDTLPGFHNIRFRYHQWDEILAADRVGRAKDLKTEIGWIESRREEMLSFYNLIETGDIPLRVTHNDTKISNILFSKDSQVLCVIDLDTVLRSPCLYDFGDAIRSYTNTGSEDDSNLDNVGMNVELYDAYLKGYLSQTKTFLTDIEEKYLPFSAIYITFEQVLRFLMDYIDGDRYYKIKYPQHNLVRARAQNKLLESFRHNLYYVK